MAPGIDWQSGRHQPILCFAGAGRAQDGAGATDRRGMRLPTPARRGTDDAARRYADWRRVHEGLVRFVTETRSFRGLTAGSPGERALLPEGERAFVALDGVHLIEARHRGGRCVGGVLFPGFEEPTSIDVGTLAVYGDTVGELRGELQRRVGDHLAARPPAS